MADGSAGVKHGEFQSFGSGFAETVCLVPEHELNRHIREQVLSKAVEL